MSGYDSHGSPKKPDNNCRTCNDFKFWSKQQRQIFYKASNVKTPSKVKQSGGGSGTHGNNNDCPLDKVLLGRSTWGLLHTIAAFYSKNPTDTQKKDMRTFIEVFSRIYPCEYCARDFRKDLQKYPVNVNSQSELAQWVCQFHNRVNVKLDKPIFDCSKVNERWRDGWRDGSCE